MNTEVHEHCIINYYCKKAYRTGPQPSHTAFIVNFLTLFCKLQSLNSVLKMSRLQNESENVLNQMFV